MTLALALALTFALTLTRHQPEGTHKI